jgi:hypothetical protein
MDMIYREKSFHNIPIIIDIYTYNKHNCNN